MCVPCCNHMKGLSWSPGIKPDGGGPGIVAPPPKFESQMGDEVADPVDTTTESAPTITNSADIMAPHLPMDHTLDVFFGDPVVSFRQCLKRYQFSRAWQPNVIPVSSGYLWWILSLPDIPIYLGAVGGAIDSAQGALGVPTPWNYAQCTLLNYLLPAYAAR